MSAPVSVKRGNLPLVLAMPHSGTDVPDDIFAKLNTAGQTLADTDWHIPRLYEGLLNDVTIVQAHFHRYVIDANRPPGGQSLYPGQNTTGLCPLINFEGKSLYKKGQELNAAEIEFRRDFFHRPYHQALEAELARLRDQYGYAILYDCHSIRSEIDFLFEGKLPDLNIGTFDGRSSTSEISDAAMEICRAQSEFTHILNGRFKGGWTTRHYGQPEQNIHAFQMELCQSTYMDEETPWTYHAHKAEHIRSLLKKLLLAIIGTDLS